MPTHEEPAGRAAQLTALRTRYPHYRIWQETAGERTCYVARRQGTGTGPHTLVTGDVSELAAALASAHAIAGQR